MHEVATAREGVAQTPSSPIIKSPLLSSKQDSNSGNGGSGGSQSPSGASHPPPPPQLAKTLILATMKKAFKFLLIFPIILFITPVYSDNYSAYTAKVTSGKVVKTTEFDCNEIIYAFFEAKIPEKTEENVSFSWLFPSGRTSHTQKSLKLLSESTYYAWDGHNLNRYHQLGSSIAQIFDPSQGKEKYIGDWSIKVRYKKKEINLTLSVLC